MKIFIKNILCSVSLILSSLLVGLPIVASAADTDELSEYEDLASDVVFDNKPEIETKNDENALKPNEKLVEGTPLVVRSRGGTEVVFKEFSQTYYIHQNNDHNELMNEFVQASKNKKKISFVVDSKLNRITKVNNLVTSAKSENSKQKINDSKKSAK